MLSPQSELPAFTQKQVGQSYLEGFDTPQGFQLSRVCSTDPAMYLRKELSPGSIYSGENQK